MKNTQLSLKFYEDEKIPSTPKPKYGDLAIVGREKKVNGEYIKFNVIVILLTNKEYRETSYNWRYSFLKNGEIPIQTLESFNWEVRYFNYYLDRNKIKYYEREKPMLLKRANKSNTNIGDELVRIVKVQRKYIKYETENITYDGTMSLKGYFKNNL